jgi:hypothetical protein
VTAALDALGTTEEKSNKYRVNMGKWFAEAEVVRTSLLEEGTPIDLNQTVEVRYQLKGQVAAWAFLTTFFGFMYFMGETVLMIIFMLIMLPFAWKPFFSRSPVLILSKEGIWFKRIHLPWEEILETFIETMPEGSDYSGWNRLLINTPKGTKKVLIDRLDISVDEIAHIIESFRQSRSITYKLAKG